MDLHLSAEIDGLRRRYRGFVAARVMPLEADPAAYDAHENIRLERLEELRAKTRDAGRRGCRGRRAILLTWRSARPRE